MSIANHKIVSTNMALAVCDFLRVFALMILSALTPRTTSLPSSECGFLMPDKGKIPWTVGIYLEQQKNHLELVCLGSVLKDNYVVTASQCVCETLSQDVRKENIYVSKKIAKVLKRNPKTTFNIKPENVIKPAQYQGFLINPVGDLAVLKAESSLGHPVCVDWSDLTTLLQTNTTGVLSVWDTQIKTMDSLLSDYDSCASFTSENFGAILGTDKNCFKIAESNLDHQSTGSGIYYQNPKNEKWYLEGVVSGSEMAKDNVFVAATSIRRYLSWLSRVCAT